MRNFSPVSEMGKGQRSWDVFWVKIQETKHTGQNTKILTFTTLTILKAVLLNRIILLNRMRKMIWKIRQAMQDDAICATSQPTLSFEHIESFAKDLVIRQDLRNYWAGPVNRAREGVPF